MIAVYFSPSENNSSRADGGGDFFIVCKIIETGYYHNQAIIYHDFGTRLKGSDTQKHLIRSLIVLIALSIRETCCPDAHISKCADILPSSFWNSSSAFTTSRLKPRFLKRLITFSIPLMMTEGPLLYVTRRVPFFWDLLIRLKVWIAWNLIVVD